MLPKNPQIQIYEIPTSWDVALPQLGTITIYAQNIGINATGATPDTKAILDISSTTSGLLIPRMSTAERNAITTPPTGLQVYNTTTNTLDIYKGSIWDQMASADTSIKLVRSLSDLPSPVGNEIKLDSTKTYSFFWFGEYFALLY